MNQTLTHPAVPRAQLDIKVLTATVGSDLEVTMEETRDGLAVLAMTPDESVTWACLYNRYGGIEDDQLIQPGTTEDMTPLGGQS